MAESCILPDFGAERSDTSSLSPQIAPTNSCIANVVSLDPNEDEFVIIDDLPPVYEPKTKFNKLRNLPSSFDSTSDQKPKSSKRTSLSPSKPKLTATSPKKLQINRYRQYAISNDVVLLSDSDNEQTSKDSDYQSSQENSTVLGSSKSRRSTFSKVYRKMNDELMEDAESEIFSTTSPKSISVADNTPKDVNNNVSETIEEKTDSLSITEQISSKFEESDFVHLIDSQEKTTTNIISQHDPITSPINPKKRARVIEEDDDDEEQQKIVSVSNTSKIVDTTDSTIKYNDNITQTTIRDETPLVKDEPKKKRAKKAESDDEEFDPLSINQDTIKSTEKKKKETTKKKSSEVQQNKKKTPKKVASKQTESIPVIRPTQHTTIDQNIDKTIDKTIDQNMDKTIDQKQPNDNSTNVSSKDIVTSDTHLPTTDGGSTMPSSTSNNSSSVTQKKEDLTKKSSQSNSTESSNSIPNPPSEVKTTTTNSLTKSTKKTLSGIPKPTASSTLHSKPLASSTLHSKPLASSTLHSKPLASSTLHSKPLASSTLPGQIPGRPPTKPLLRIGLSRPRQSLHPGFKKS